MLQNVPKSVRGRTTLIQDGKQELTRWILISHMRELSDIHKRKKKSDLITQILSPY